MTTSSTPLERSEEGRAFLQHRVGRFGLFGACLGAFFLVLRTISALIYEHFEELTDPSFLLHALGAFSLLAIWLGCRGGPASAARIRVFEAFGLTAAAVAYSAMGWHMPMIALEEGQEFLIVDRGADGENCDEHFLSDPVTLLAG